MTVAAVSLNVPIVPFSIYFFSASFFRFIISSANLLYLLLLPSPLLPPSSPLCPSLTSWGNLAAPSLPVPSSSLVPSCMQSRCQPGQGGQRLTHKGGNWVLGVNHTHTLNMCSPLPLLCAPSIHMHFTHMCALSFTHSQLPWAGPELGTGAARAVCLSVISIPAGGSWPGQTSERSSRSR